MKTSLALLCVFFISSALATSKYDEEAVKVYFIDGCPVCAKLFQFLDTEDIEHDRLDIANDYVAAREYEELQAKEIPVIVIGDDVIVGYDKAKIMKALEKANN